MEIDPQHSKAIDLNVDEYIHKMCSHEGGRVRLTGFQHATISILQGTIHRFIKASDKVPE